MVSARVLAHGVKGARCARVPRHRLRRPLTPLGVPSHGGQADLEHLGDLGAGEVAAVHELACSSPEPAVGVACDRVEVDQLEFSGEVLGPRWATSREFGCHN